MMDLIDRAAVEKSMNDYDLWYSGVVDPMHCGTYWKKFLGKVPTIEAVPLDELCKILSAHELTAKGEPLGVKMDAAAWKLVIREWLDEKAECGGRQYWDGAMCRNPQSRSYGRETDEWCERKDDLHEFN